MQYEQATLRRLQMMELEILEAIDSVCREHGITYFLDSGTVLGARRHGGFIPWDDDIDLGMPREDYERFLEVAPVALGERFCVTCSRMNPRQAALFAKVMLTDTRFVTDETEEAGFDQGVFVDIFPYDAVCAESNAAKRQRKRCMMWQSISYLYHSKHIVVPHKGAMGTIEAIACRVAHYAVRALFSPERINRGFDKVAMIAKDDSESDMLMASSYAATEPFPKSMLLPPSVICFEGKEFFAPADVEGYLRTQYGQTWNQLPPEDQRRNHAPKELYLGKDL
ncbi:phosphorylcholine transferase LicD [uncultured Senegalimassilia sp.]|uniref:LicD family protein n=1 Tax=uncultured Senegalimassilia sp. TaxID=1714350 RepID=UPI0025F34596|nr:LicD family protein [uncultured Senegalimassilia sp.]